MADAAAKPMTAEAFLAWKDARCELIGGAPTRMMGERARHAAAKTRLTRQMMAQLPEGAPCRLWLDGMAVRVAEDQVFEPDLMIQCGGAVADDALAIDDPWAVFEILFPTTSSFDMARKAPAYLTMPSLSYVVILDPDKRRGCVLTRATSTVYGAEDAILLPLQGCDINGDALRIDLAAVFAEA